jgi:hypothetical protein
VIEAMASDRPYRPALGLSAALKEVTRYRGQLFDRAAVDACAWAFAHGDFAFSEAHSTSIVCQGGMLYDVRRRPWMILLGTPRPMTGRAGCQARA